MSPTHYYYYYYYYYYDCCRHQMIARSNADALRRRRCIVTSLADSRQADLQTT